MIRTNDVRETFLNFFQKNNHNIVSSSPLIPHNDPTLLFTNAGMVQFKNYFTGTEKPDYLRATTSQKCVRAGGKHNDLENVGHTARHHTFFEMLGNFSFGDYFKEEAIKLAWDLITKEYKLPKEKLLVTVYSEDSEAYNLWKKIAGFSDDKIIKISTSDNFWSMGETGPCGPCSEIFYDHGEGIFGGPPGSPDEDGDRFIEIWNLVFMQYEQISSDKRVNLPKPSIDTGMGLERMTAVLQGKHNNYEIDLFTHLIEACSDLTHKPINDQYIASHRVIADHLRSSCFLIADGILPSNEGRGYVLRRIMRRAMRHAHILGQKDPLLWKLTPYLIEMMGHAFPELNQAQSLIVETLKMEETNFKLTLERGLKLLEKETNSLAENTPLSGSVAFKLYDTYGFPLDLTEDILKNQNRSVDRKGFEDNMARQKEEARKAWKGSGDQATDEIWFDVKEQSGFAEFLGYDTNQAQGEITALVANNKIVDQIDTGKEAIIITNQTPFYGESGGQIGDKGVIIINNSFFEVHDTQKKLGDLFIHIGQVKKGSFKKGDVVDLKIDDIRRKNLRAHHSATHLLHEVLRRKLGTHVTQKGSLVMPDRLRFDFSHNSKLTKEEIINIENEVNEQIRNNSSVNTFILPPKEALNMGAIALFGEKYPDEVRVVCMGDLQEKIEKKQFSIEFCGGTHVKRTGDIGVFKIIQESAVSSGIRRIEACTGQAAEHYIQKKDQILSDIALSLKTSYDQAAEKINSLIQAKKKLESDLKKGKNASSTSQSSSVKKFGTIQFYAAKLEDTSPKDLKGIADSVINEGKADIVALFTKTGEKASLVVAVNKNIANDQEYNAINLVKVGSEAIGGKGGGGRIDMAQAGGPDYNNIDSAIISIENELKKIAS